MKKNKIWEKYVFSFFIYFLLSAQCLLYSQEYSQPLGSRSRGFANANILLSDVWAAANNQAAMSTSSKLSIGYCHALKFGIKELQTIGFAAVIPAKNVALGISGLSYGNKNYHENKYGIAISKHIGNNYGAGVQFNYYNTYLAEYERMGSVAVEFGMYGEPNENLRVAFHATNPFKSGVKINSDYKLESIYKVAMGFKFDKGFIFEEVQSTIYEELNFITGVEYPLKQFALLRFGYSTNPEIISGGISMRFKSFHLSCDFQYHSVLGITPSLSVHHEL